MTPALALRAADPAAAGVVAELRARLLRRGIAADELGTGDRVPPGHHVVDVPPPEGGVGATVDRLLAQLAERGVLPDDPELRRDELLLVDRLRDLGYL